MLMVLVSDESPQGGARLWAAIREDGHGRAFTRAQAEAIAARETHDARFLFAFTEQSEHFGPPDGKAPTLALLPGETIWHYGEPTRVDSVKVLRDVMDGAECPDPESVLLPVNAVVAHAAATFGNADPHDIETHFDALVVDLDGRRAGDPPVYVVPIGRLLGVG